MVAQSLKEPSARRLCIDSGWPQSGRSFWNRYVMRRGQNKTKRNGSLASLVTKVSVQREQSRHLGISAPKRLVQMRGYMGSFDKSVTLGYPGYLRTVGCQCGGCYALYIMRIETGSNPSSSCWKPAKTGSTGCISFWKSWPKTWPRALKQSGINCRLIKVLPAFPRARVLGLARCIRIACPATQGSCGSFVWRAA